MDIARNLRVRERRLADRRRVLPESIKHHLGWMLQEERRKNERRATERRVNPG
jgi:hypothetical protein